MLQASDVNWSEILVDAPCFLKSSFCTKPLMDEASSVGNG